MSVTGKLAPDTLNPAPLRAAELMVTAAVPALAKVTVCAGATVFTATLPKETLEVFSVRPDTAAFSCTGKLSVTLPAIAVRMMV